MQAAALFPDTSNLRGVQSPSVSLFSTLEASFSYLFSSNFSPLPFAVAVSGGRDSLALTLLAHAWVTEQGGHLTALTVDHALRPESAAEVARVAAWMRARAIPHCILRWDGPKPATGLQAAAREARYRLLADWCRAHNVAHLLFAHQREDQLETFYLRLLSGSGPRGLACMPVSREAPLFLAPPAATGADKETPPKTQNPKPKTLHFLRPLLGVPRTALTSYLQAENQPWIDDPSNASPAFTRSSLRAMLPEIGRSAIPPETILHAVRAFGRLRRAEDILLNVWLARHATLHPEGYISLPRQAFAALPCSLAELVLARIQATLTGAPHPPRGGKLAALTAFLQTPYSPSSRRTLGGLAFALRRHEILAYPEPHTLPQPAPIPAVISSLRWDARFVLTHRSDESSSPAPITLAPLGPHGLRQLRLQNPALAARLQKRHPAAVLHALPALFDLDGLHSLPHIPYSRANAIPLFHAVFQPSHPLQITPFHPFTGH